MTFPIRGTKHRSRVRFMKQAMPISSSSIASSASSLPLSAESRNPQSGVLLEELSDDDDFFWEEDSGPPSGMAEQSAFHPSIPDLFTVLPPLYDSGVSKTSRLQSETVQEILPYLAARSGEFATYNRYGVPQLDRARHIRFLHQTLQRLPEQYVAADAARPWFFYWALCGLQTMGEDVSSYRERLVSTVRSMQNVTGGFGGGHGQMSHLAPTYAVILSLSIVGGTALDVVDRLAMWRWLGALKQPDGGFEMSTGGEVDVRGTYCAAVIISLLDLPVDLLPGSTGKVHETDTLLTRIPEYVSRCQTYEGGIASRPDGEAHGAYTFCALACLCILDVPHNIMPKYLDVPALVSWLSSRQYAPEGGFAGRTNKLVDGCYSHWVGACFPLVSAALSQSRSTKTTHAGKRWSLFHREGLTRYILCACQDTSRRGGLRDKPSKNSDGYHTCYILAGLSAVQHSWSSQAVTPSSSSEPQLLSGILSAPYNWHLDPEAVEDEAGSEIFDSRDLVRPLHPVFVVPDGVAERTKDYFAGGAS